MKIISQPLASLLFASLLSMGGASLAQAQKPVKEANKLNEQRNDLKAESSQYSKDQLDYDAEFVVAAASSHALEVRLGQLAQQKAIATEVRDWGSKMATEHGNDTRQLMSLAYRHHITLPQSLSKDDQKIYDDVDDRKYLGFDKKYLRSLQELHERTLKRYAEAATKLSHPDLQQYAAQMLPQLRQDEMAIAQLYERADERK